MCTTRYRFAVTTMTGTERTVERTRFAFLTRHIADVPVAAVRVGRRRGAQAEPKHRHTADVPHPQRRRHHPRHLPPTPVLIRDDDPDGNPWGLSFARLFDMANDSGLFHQPDDFADDEFNGWSYKRDGKEYVPLYEAKMLGHFDHRFSTYRGATQAQLNVGTLPRLTDDEHDDPDLEPLARYWVDRTEVAAKLAGQVGPRLAAGLARHRTSRATRAHSSPRCLPTSAVGNKFPLAFPDEPATRPLLHALWSSIVFDYVARQKLSGTHMTYFIVKQLACPQPDSFDADRPPWQPNCTLADWLRPYVLELSYTSWRLKPYAEDLGDDGPPFRWDPERRALLRADLDAALPARIRTRRGEKPSTFSTRSPSSASTTSATSASTAPSASSSRPTTVWPTLSPTAARDGSRSPTYQRDLVPAITNEPISRVTSR